MVSVVFEMLAAAISKICFRWICFETQSYGFQTMN
jgi:hypothetical protein